jgi:hemophore-related protein
LFTHPDLNDFMTSLKELSREHVASEVKGYMASHADEQADMAGIHCRSSTSRIGAARRQLPRN